MLKEIFDEVGIEVASLFAGLAGGLASITKDKNLTRGQRFITVVVGGLISAYLTPIFGIFLNMPDQAKYGIGFVIGYSGLRSVEWVIEKYFKKKPTDQEEQKDNNENA